MHPVVLITQPSGIELFVSIRGPIDVGRECDGILLADPQVSRRHFSLDVHEGRVVVTDLGSTNGVSMDGRRLDAPVYLDAGRVAHFGESTIALDAAVTATVVASRSVGKSTVVGVPAFDPAGTVLPGSPVSASSVGTTDATQHRQRPADPSSVGRQSSIDIVAESVRSEGVQIEQLRGDQGTITIVFSDIESSTQRNVELGDQAWFALLGVHNDIVIGRVQEFGGAVIKNQGDGFMMSFPGARQALDCMTQVQRDLSAHSTAYPDRVIRIRIGLHTGEVLADADGDLFGAHVAMAARVANEADGNEILLSSLTREIVASRGDLTFGEPRPVHLKGFGDATVFPFDWSRPIA